MKADMVLSPAHYSFLPQGLYSRVKSLEVDLLIPSRNFSFYHPDQVGCASIKHVLPALTDTSYSDLSINEGMAASLAFVEMVFNQETPDERKAVIRKDLLEYCELDTKAMVEGVTELEESSDDEQEEKLRFNLLGITCEH